MLEHPCHVKVRKVAKCFDNKWHYVPVARLNMIPLKRFLRIHKAKMNGIEEGAVDRKDYWYDPDAPEVVHDLGVPVNTSPI